MRSLSSTRMSFVLWAALVFIVGCGGSGSVAGPDMALAMPSSTADLDLADNAEKFDVPGFSLQLSRRWLLIGNRGTPGDSSLRVLAITPADAHRVDLWIDRARVVPLRGVPGRFAAEVDVSTLGAGLHQLAFVANGSTIPFARRVVVRTAPLYVVVSCDWDNSDNSDVQLQLMRSLRASHPGLVYSHFFGPYTLTDPNLAPARRDLLVAWIKHEHDAAGDEIGLHIHTRCSFVPAAGLPCRTMPSWLGGSDATGYSVLLPDAYSEAEQKQLIDTSLTLFAKFGMGRPTSFRSGAWAADATTLRALEATGFTVESSAVAWQLLGGIMNTNLYPWLQMHWPGFDTTSQPYHPSKTHAPTPDPPPSLSLLEVPDNGALIDYVSGAQMIDVFKQNRPAPFLVTPRVYQVGFHPPSINDSLAKQLDIALRFVDDNSWDADAGPAVYVTLDKLPLVW